MAGSQAKETLGSFRVTFAFGMEAKVDFAPRRCFATMLALVSLWP
jgi:hypothetical protein